MQLRQKLLGHFTVCAGHLTSSAKFSKIKTYTVCGDSCSKLKEKRKMHEKMYHVENCAAFWVTFLVPMSQSWATEGGRGGQQHHLHPVSQSASYSICCPHLHQLVLSSLLSPVFVFRCHVITINTSFQREQNPDSLGAPNMSRLSTTRPVRRNLWLSWRRETAQ